MSSVQITEEELNSMRESIINRAKGALVTDDPTDEQLIKLAHSLEEFGTGKATKLADDIKSYIRLKKHA